MSESIARAQAPNPKQTLRETLAQRRLDAHRSPLAHEALAQRVLAILAQCAPRTVGFYWPLPGEFDARDAIASWLAGDASRQAALPVIGAPRTPLEFHAWTPDAPMREGRHRIVV